MALGRRLLAPKLALVVAIAGGAALVARLRAGPASEAPVTQADPLLAAAEHFSQVLATRIGVAPGRVVVVPATAAPLGPGRPVEVWYDAPVAIGLPRDLYVFSARISSSGVPLVLDAPEAVVPSVAGSETLLAAQPGQALVAIGTPPQVVSLRRRAGGRLDLQLDTPTEISAPQITPEGFSLRVGAQPIEVKPGHPPPLGTLVVVPLRAAEALVGEAVIDAPLAPPAPDASLGLPPRTVPGLDPWRLAAPGIWQSRLGDIHLFVFDSKALQLAFSAGLDATPNTGLGGRGRTPREAEARAWLDGPPVAAAEAGRLLTPPVRLAASVLTEEGRTLLGPWDREAEGVAGDLAQAADPLVQDGEVRPRRVHRPEHALQVARSALGATEEGVLVYAWSAATTATALGDALRRVGVQYAMPLGLGTTARGLRLAGAPSPVEGMSADSATPRNQNTFLVVPREGFVPEAPWQALGSAPIRLATRVGPGAIRWLQIDPLAVRMRLVPGPAEPWSGEGTPPVPAVEAEALAHLTFGVRTLRAPFGLSVGDQRWRAPRPDAFTLALDSDGRAHLGRFGRGIDAQRSWAALIQGPSLLEGGRRVVEPVVPDGLPVAAVGRRPDGHLYFAAHPDGDVEALVSALETEGITDALRLADRGTLDGGRVLVAGADVHSTQPMPLPPVATLLEILPGEPPPSVAVVPAIR